MKKDSIIIPLSILFIFLSSSFIIYLILDNKEKQVNSIKKILLQEAKAHFNNILITRKWNASLGGVYAKGTNLKPNPYLENNHIFSNKNELLVKINPAWMTRQISDINNKNSNYYFKITSLKPINPKNVPDEFEKIGLKYFKIHKDKLEYYERNVTNNTFDFIGALKIVPSCLKCHAEQGFKVGDNRGGIRVSIPIEEHNAKIYDIERNANLSIIVVIIISLIISYLIISFFKLIFKKQKEIELLNQDLENKVQQELKKNKKQEELLFQQAKMVALGEMMTNIAHHWRQPLSAITTATSGMQLQKEMDTLDDKQFYNTTNTILEQSNYLSKTIEDFTNFFRKDEQLEQFTLYEFFHKRPSLTKDYFINDNITLELDNLDNNYLISAYPNVLYQVLLKLFENTRDQLQRKGYKEGFINISTRLEEDFLVLAICDNADGIPEDIIDKIFEPYFTTKHNSQGTGIGLYMSLHTINKHLNGQMTAFNRDIEFNDKVYCGACFEIKLPIVGLRKE